MNKIFEKTELEKKELKNYYEELLKNYQDDFEKHLKD